MSARSRASGEGGRSVVMLMARIARHGLFRLFVEAERETFHLGKITLSLFRRHGLADGDEMLQHLRLALCAQFGDFVQFCLGFRSEERRVGKECRSRWSLDH